MALSNLTGRDCREYPVAPRVGGTGWEVGRKSQGGCVAMSVLRHKVSENCPQQPVNLHGGCELSCEGMSEPELQ